MIYIHSLTTEAVDIRSWQAWLLKLDHPSMYATVSAVMSLAEELLVEYRTRPFNCQGYARVRIEENR